VEACYGGTDVMERSCAVARGIDINIRTVIQYNTSKELRTVLHRTGYRYCAITFHLIAQYSRALTHDGVISYPCSYNTRYASDQWIMNHIQGMPLQ
jgi:hypothetical protein